MRAFVALVPPADALAELEVAVAPVRAARPELRWTPSAQWHLTLAFLGEVDENVLPDLGERLSRAARRHPPMSLTFTGAGRFGDHVLWTRVLGSAVVHGGAAESGGGVHGGAAPRESRVRTGGVSRPDRPRDTDDLRRLAMSVTAAARRCRIAVDDRPYRPHLTLARARDSVDLRSAVAAVAGFAGSPWTADALHLFRSLLGAGPGGTARHEVVAAWPLGR